MLIRPRAHDLRVIAFHLGRVISVLGIVTLAPTVVALVLGEWNAAAGFVATGSATLAAGRILVVSFRTHERLDWFHGMVVAAMGWLVGSATAAVPLYLSGHVRDFGSGTFEAMSGLTTTGLTLVEDLDHLAHSLNLWRHLLELAGGQATVVIAVTLLTAAGSQAGLIYGSGSHRERIVPQVSRSARSALYVTGSILGVAFVALTVAVVIAGVPPTWALLHGFALAASAVDTAGFALRSTSVAYYHSLSVELVLIVFMLAGALSIIVHQTVWRSGWRELLRDLEARTLGVSLFALIGLTLAGLGRAGAFTDAGPLFRKGVFSVVSAHTTTGLSVTEERLLTTDWGLLAPAALVGAMAIGGTFASTAGGMKSLRLGIVAKSLVKDVRGAVLPESALVVSTYHRGRRQQLTDGRVRAAATVIVLFLMTYLAGGLVGLYYGETFTGAVFESVSATANGGLSAGVLQPGGPQVLQSTLFVQMWLGRLEFMGAFALFGYLAAWLRGRA